jgi:hypothetical protein
MLFEERIVFFFAETIMSDIDFAALAQLDATHAKALTKSLSSRELATLLAREDVDAFFTETAHLPLEQFVDMAKAVVVDSSRVQDVPVQREKKTSSYLQEHVDEISTAFGWGTALATWVLADHIYPSLTGGETFFLGIGTGFGAYGVAKLLTLAFGEITKPKLIVAPTRGNDPTRTPRRAPYDVK